MGVEAGQVITDGTAQFTVRSHKQQDLIDLIYPVGSIYMSVNATSPAALFGGTWEQIQDRFLLAAGSTYDAGSTGGEATHQLSVEELPDRTMVSLNANGTTINPPNSGGAWSKFERSSWGDACLYDFATQGMDIKYAQPFLILPPYIAVYIWKRVS